VWSVPRFATVKFADSDFANGTLGQTGDGIFTSTQDHKAYRNVQFRYSSPFGPVVSSIGGNHAVASIVTLNANTSTTVQSTVGIPGLAPLDLFAKADISDGTLVFRTQQTAVAQAMDDELQFPHNETIDYANSTIAFMNSNFNIGREDDGTHYSFPKTAGSARDYLRLGGTGTDLEFVNAFAGLVSDEGTVVGDVTFDIATADIFNVETAGDISDLILSNAPVGTRATIIIKQGSTTGALTGSTDWLWAGGNKTLSTTTGDIDVIKVTYDGTNYLGELTTGYVA